MIFCLCKIDNPAHSLFINKMSLFIRFGSANFIILLIAIYRTFKIKHDSFYGASVHFASSPLSMIILGLFGLYCILALAIGLKSLFFGQLRLIEIEVILLIKFFFEIF